MNRYYDAIKLSLVAFVALIVASLILPSHGPSDDVELVLTVSTFLFAILAGFFTSRLNDRFNDIKNLVASEDAYFTTLYRFSRKFSPSFLKKVTKIIENYYITCFDFEISQNYKYTSTYIDQLNALVINYKPRNANEAILLEEMTEYLLEIEVCRNQQSVSVLQSITAGHWTILSILCSIIVISVFYLKSGSLFSYVTTVMLSTVVIMVILIMRDIKNFQLYGPTLAVESGQEQFELMGLDRYYHENYLEEIKYLPSYVKRYRLGHHKPGSTKFDIELVKIK
jgi:hypothetical protein